MSGSLPQSLIPPEPGDPMDLETRPRPASAHNLGTRLAGRIAVVSDGASGLGQAVAAALAREGANMVIAWLNEPEAAAQTVALIEAEGRLALSIPGDIGNPDFAAELVRQAVAAFGRIDVLVNNATQQHACADFEDIEIDQVERSFRTNTLGPFWLTKAALPHMAEGACIINTASVSAYIGDPDFVDYAASAGAVVAFTRSLALQLSRRGIRVNAVAPGRNSVKDAAPSFVFLASPDAASMSGQVLHPNGGVIVNG